MIKLFAEHRVAANLAMIMMLMAGVWAVRSMPSQLDPPANLPMVFINVQWPGASAEDVAALITTPIEQQLRTLPELNEIRSSAGNGYTQIRVRFEFDADMTIGLDQVKQRVSNIRNLPSGIEPPTISRFIDREPITALMVQGEGSLRELVPLIRGFEKDLMARGVEEVEYDGLPEEELAIQVSGRRLSELGVTLPELAREIAKVSQDVPAGSIGSGHGARQLRSLDQRRDVLSFEQMPVQTNDQLVRLADIAEIERRPQRGQPLVTTQGQPAIEMILFRATDADAYHAHQIVERWLEEVRPGLPAGVTISKTIDIWTMLGAQIDMIVKNGLSGLILVMGVLFLFLSGRVGTWVTIGIPVSFMFALALFHGFFGYGVSIIALIGFIMALGIVVDDAIVVGEDVVTHFENGASPLEAAVAGAQRMWIPVVTSSLTTLAAFLPLLIIGGMMGAMILALPTVLLCVIVASLIECFLVLPGHLRASLSKAKVTKAASWRARFDAGFIRFRDQRFMPIVHKALDYPGATLCAALGGFAFALSLIASQHVPFNLVTGFDFESVEANVEFSAAATDGQKQSFIAQLERTLGEVDVETGDANLESWAVKHNLARLNEERVTGEQYAALRGSYAFEEERTVAPQEFARLWREKVQRPAYVEQLTIGVDGGQNNGQADLTLVLSGSSLDRLKEGAQALATILASYPGVANVTDNLPFGKEQIIFSMTPAGRSLGLTSEDIGRQLRAAYAGIRVQIFNESDSELEVRVMLPDEERDDIASLQRFPVRLPSGEFVPLASVADLSSRRGIDVIRHSDGRLAVTLSADVDADVNNAMAVIADIKEQHLQLILDRYDLKFGLGGKSAQDELILGTMALGGMLALLLIYLILAWVFSSYLWPLAIMMAIPFGFTGAVLGHWVTGWDVGAMSLLAFFALTGIVVNDSIVLISFLRRDVDAGRPVRPALRDAVKARFRAVMLTSLTTIAGLSPLMFETSTLSFYVAPIAVTVCFGLALATFLVLIVVPALILLLEQAKARLVAVGGVLLESSRRAVS